MADSDKRGGTYKVTHQEVGKVFRPDGTTDHEWTVHLEHADGTKGVITMPDSAYTAENVHQAAQAQSDAVMKVAALPASVTGE